MMVSLPSKWVKEQGVKKGDEIFLEIEGQRVIVGTQGSRGFLVKEIDISGLGERMGKRLIGALYKAGYDEIWLKFSDPSYFRFIQRVVDQTCLGHEIVENSINHCVIRRVAESMEEQFPTLLRQKFSLLLSNIAEGVIATRALDYETLNNIALRDQSVNKFSDVCRRITNKVSFGELRKNTTMYHLLEQLEKVGDDVRDISLHIADKNLKLNKETLEVYQMLSDYLHHFFRLHYNFSLKELRKFSDYDEKVSAALSKLKETKHSDPQLLTYFDIFHDKVFSLNGALMTYHL